GDRLGDGGHGGVAVDEDRDTERVAQAIGEREIAEAGDIRRVVHQATHVVQRTGGGAARGRHVANCRLGRRERRARAVGDRGDDVGPSGERGRTLVAAEDRRNVAVTRDHGPHVRTAEIDAEEEAQTLGSLPATSGACSTEASPRKIRCCAALYPFLALSLPKAFSASS